MKATLFILFFFLGILPVFSQTWNEIGVPQGTNIKYSDLYIDDQSGRLFMAYVETSSNRSTVKEWINGAWQTVGNPDFGTGVQKEIDLAMSNNELFAAVRYTSASSDFVQVYQLFGTFWNTVGFAENVFPDTEIELKTAPDGRIILQSGSTGDLSVVYPMGSVGLISNGGSNTPADFVVDQTGNTWAIRADGGSMVMLEIMDSFSGSFSFVSVLQYSMFNFDEVQINSNNSLFVQTAYRFQWSLQFQQLTNGTMNVFHSFNGTTTDFDMDTDDDESWIIQQTDTYNEIFSINLATAQVTSFGSNIAGNDGVVVNPQLECWNNRTVVSFEDNGKLYVYELDNQAVVSVAGNIQVCEQIAYMSSSNFIQVEDNNYSHNNLYLQFSSLQPLLIDPSNISITGSVPDYGFNFISNPINSDQTAIVDFLLYENNALSGTATTIITLYDAPEVNLVTETLALCHNASSIDLDTMVSPSGGTWAGPGIVAGNVLEPSFLSPSNFNLIYALSNAHGCVSKDTIHLTILPIPSILVDNVVISDCNDDNGEIEISVSGGVTPYVYQWSNGLQIQDIFGLVAGYYTVNVSDANNCSNSATISTVASELDIQGNVQHVLCIGDSNGSIDLNFDPDDLAMIQSIEWSNGSTTEDISGLSAGVYEVFVTGTNGCINSAIFEVLAPSAIAIQTFNMNSDCSSSNGSVSCAVTGGVGPYSYAWSDFFSGNGIGSNLSSVNNLSQGAYQVQITDMNGCQDSAIVTISDNNGPSITTDSLFYSGCNNNGAVYISVSSPSGIASILWEDNSTNEDHIGLAPGDYFVEVIDNNGCVSFEEFQIGRTALDIVPICVVTVDTTTNTNLVVWEKPISTEISSFNVYRETSVAGTYVLVGNVPYADETIFNDIVASPSVRSWRYKISSVSICGVESDLSDVHKTIHLSMSIGIGGTVNLNWDSYEGFTYPQFEIFRYTDANGWEMIQQMPNNLFSYTDNPPATVNIGYFISIPLVEPCDSLSRAISQNTARSNRTTSMMDPGNDIKEINDQFTLFPNPTSGAVNIRSLKLGQSISFVNVMDINGRIVNVNSSIENETLTISLADLNPGVYFITFLNEGKICHERVIKQ